MLLMVWADTAARTAGRIALVLWHRSVHHEEASKPSGVILKFYPLNLVRFPHCHSQQSLLTLTHASLMVRVEGLFIETMTAGLGLPLQQDHVTALAFAAVLLAFAVGDVANRALLAQAEAIQLAGMLLKVRAVFMLSQSSRL